MSSVIRFKSFVRASQGVAMSEEMETSLSVARIAEENQMRDQELKRRYQQGFEAGFNTAKKELESEFDDMMLKKSEEFYRILESFEEKLTGYESMFDTLVIKLAVKISEKIIRDEIKNHSTIENSINEAVKKVIGANQVHIKMNPADYELINSNGKAVMIERNFDKVKFEVTDNVEEGGCVIETEIGNVDARIQSQIEAISAQLESAFLKDG
jgi:flagellar assembly protein FliH